MPKSFSELQLVERLKRSVQASCRGSHVLRGIGDDTAVLKPFPKGRLELFTCDGVVEGIHFDRKLNSFLIGRKAMARNISDIAAMGGVPASAVIGLALPRDFPARKVDAIYCGLLYWAKKFGVAIVGGDTVRSPGGLSVWVSMLGWVEPRCLKLRSKAKPGDVVLVTGRLGGSLSGKHASFTPRLNEARYLVKNFPIRAMIDISDGLGIDLARICAQSGVQARIEIESLPLTKGIGSWERAVADGEDYELLFTVPKSRVQRIVLDFRRKFDLPITCIGNLSSAPGKAPHNHLPDLGMVRYYSRIGGREIPLSKKAYDHFG